VKRQGLTPEQLAERKYDDIAVCAIRKLRLLIRKAWAEYEQEIAQARKERDEVMKGYYR
jgi:hypothetical protein